MSENKGLIVISSHVRTILSAFTNVNQTLYRDFNATTLNATASVINQTINTGIIPSQNYLFATLTTDPSVTSSGGGTDSGNSDPNTATKKNTNLAMCVMFVLFYMSYLTFYLCSRIVLYVITGAVSILFCVVILSGVGFFSSLCSKKSR